MTVHALHKGMTLTNPEHPEWGVLTVSDPVGTTHFWVAFDDAPEERMMMSRTYLSRRWNDTGV